MNNTSNILYIVSIVIAAVWGICYLLWDAPPAIHSLMLLSFFGILSSILLDKQGEAAK
jgi:hypothetical protein